MKIQLIMGTYGSVADVSGPSSINEHDDFLFQLVVRHAVTWVRLLCPLVSSTPDA